MISDHRRDGEKDSAKLSFFFALLPAIHERIAGRRWVCRRYYLEGVGAAGTRKARILGGFKVNFFRHFVTAAAYRLEVKA